MHTFKIKETVNSQFFDALIHFINRSRVLTKSPNPQVVEETTIYI